jgi:hypothetical protein
VHRCRGVIDNHAAIARASEQHHLQKAAPVYARWMMWD